MASLEHRAFGCAASLFFELRDEFAILGLLNGMAFPEGRAMQLVSLLQRGGRVGDGLGRGGQGELERSNVGLERKHEILIRSRSRGSIELCFQCRLERSDDSC